MQAVLAVLQFIHMRWPASYRTVSRAADMQLQLMQATGKHSLRVACNNCLGQRQHSRASRGGWLPLVDWFVVHATLKFTSPSRSLDCTPP